MPVCYLYTSADIRRALTDVADYIDGHLVKGAYARDEKGRPVSANHPNVSGLDVHGAVERLVPGHMRHECLRRIRKSVKRHEGSCSISRYSDRPEITGSDVAKIVRLAEHEK